MLSRICQELPQIEYGAIESQESKKIQRTKNKKQKY